MSPQRRIPVWLAIVAASVPMFMATLDNLVVTNALPTLQSELDASVEQLQWFINAYSLAFASFILMAVALGDRFGRRRVFTAGIAVFTVASILCALATTPDQLIAARVIQGIGAAAVLPLSLAILSTTVEKRLRPVAIGVWGGISGLGVALGPLIGGAVVEGLNWNAIFWLNVPVGVISIVLVRVALVETFGARLRPDIVGLVLGMLGVFGLVFGIVRGNDAGWTSGEVLAGLFGGAALIVAFVAWERRTPHALLPLRLFSDRSFSVANVVGLLFSLGMFGAIFILIQFLQVVQGHSPLKAGILTMPWTLAPIAIAPIAGLLGPRLGSRTLITLGLTFQAVGLAWLALALDPAVSYGSLVPAFVLCGIGMALVFAPSATAVLANMSEDDRAKASGTNSTVREVGVALGIAVLTAVFTGTGGTFTPDGYSDSAVPAVAVGAAVLAAAVVVSRFLPSLREEREAAAESAQELPAVEDVAGPEFAAVAVR